MGSLRKLWHWLADKHDVPEPDSSAGSVVGIIASSNGSSAGTAAVVPCASQLRQHVESNTVQYGGDSGSDSIIGAVVLAEILAGNHAATDALTFGTPYTGQELNDDHFSGGGGEFSGAGSSGSFDSVDTSSDSSGGESSSSDSDSSSSSSGD